VNTLSMEPILNLVSTLFGTPYSLLANHRRGERLDCPFRQQGYSREFILCRNFLEILAKFLRQFIHADLGSGWGGPPLMTTWANNPVHRKQIPRKTLVSFNVTPLSIEDARRLPWIRLSVAQIVSKLLETFGRLADRSFPVLYAARQFSTDVIRR